MQDKLAQLGNKVDHKIYSPQDFGIPQHRKRIFVVGCLTGLEHFSFTEIDNQKKSLVDINQFIETNPKDFKDLPKANLDCIKLCQTFIDQIPKKTKLPGFPI